MKVADVTSTSLPDFLSSHSFYHLSVFTVVLLVCGAFYVWSDSDSRRGGAFDVALPDETTW